jgi:DNA-binding cell septation regulator SpoVG
MEVFFEVGEINIAPLKQHGSLVGFASCVINNWFYFGGIAIHTDLPTRGFRLVYPTKKLQNGLQIPLYHPITKTVAEKIQIAVTSEWERLINN